MKYTPRPLTLALLCCVTALAACVQVEGRYLDPAPALLGGQATALENPSGRIVVLFNHGSRSESKADRCDPDGKTTPLVIKSLAGERLFGLTLAVYAYCTPSRKGTYNHKQGHGEPKVVKRAKDIEAIAARYIAAGLPPQRLFLAGQSAGAWASLLVARRGKARFNAVIGLAPAFAGRRSSRPEGWWQLRARQAAYLSEAPRIDALIYAFEGDSHETPRELAFLRNIPGIDLRPLSGEAIEGVACARPQPHRTGFRDCFFSTQRQAILDYIAVRLAATLDTT